MPPFISTKPDFLYVVASSKALPRATVLRHGISLLCAGAAFYGKRRGMLLVDKDGKSFEVFLLPNHRASKEEISSGASLFGSLRQYDFVGNLVPGR